MIGNLLDTNIAIHSVFAPDPLTRSARRAIASAPNFISTVTLWEVVIKTSKGLLNVGDHFEWWRRVLSDLNAEALEIRREHILRLAKLPLLHKDPFDRILIAQATFERLTIVTTDDRMSQYRSADLEIIL